MSELVSQCGGKITTDGEVSLVLTLPPGKLIVHAFLLSADFFASSRLTRVNVKTLYQLFSTGSSQEDRKSYRHD